MIAWLYNLLSIFSSEITVTYAAVIFPVIMFSLTIIAFFLFTRKIFSRETKTKRNIIALIATAFFAIIPPLLPRTIAGIPEKESAGFLFIFLAFYFILEAFNSAKFKKSALFAILAGISSGALALLWGGITYVLMTISGAVLLAFLLGKIDKNKAYSFLLWTISFLLIAMPFSTRYSFRNILTSTSTGMMMIVAFILLVDLLLKKIKIKQIEKIKLPPQIKTLIVTLILGLIFAILFFGPSFLVSKVNNIIDNTIHPLDVSRFGRTVAENKQPSFLGEWKESFGPVYFNIPLYFWLFIIGSIVMFFKIVNSLSKKEKILLTIGYIVFLMALIFSNYSPSSTLNGDSFLSLAMYFGGMILFLGICIKVYWNKFKKNQLDDFNKFDFGYLLYFVIFTMTIIGARGAIRLIMVLAAVTPIAVGILIVEPIYQWKKEKRENWKIFLAIVSVIILISSILSFNAYYQSSKYNAENFAPTIYTQQWQKAMSWVRNNTQENAVFAHWWDYGYWIQSIGERATVLDGGNAIGYWNHLLGRYVLTGLNEKEALEFLYPHNATHLLIDSTELGKYTAFSSIGSDEDYDRFSWIQTMLIDESQTRETQNETIYVYTGGTLVDEDIIFEQDSKTIFLPRKKAVLGGIIVKMTNEGKIKQPEAAFFYNNQQYRIPLNKVFIEGKMYEFNGGINSGVFIYPSVENNQIKNIGALIYLSNRTISSNLVKWYLFGEESEYFKLVYNEPDYVVESLNQQRPDIIKDFVYYGGFRGPIKIWKVNYPLGIEYHPEYLETHYPDLALNLAKEGEY
jgi:asparagine N-glycosylation enzyme membrane subunit Stt3